MVEKIDQKFEDQDGLAEEIWKFVKKSDTFSKEDFVFLEKNPDVIQKIASGKEYEMLLDRYDTGLSDEAYYDGLIDLVKKEISYKKLKIKSEIVGLKNLIWDKITDMCDSGKIETEDCEMIQNNKDVLDDWVEGNYEKLSEVKDEKNEEKLKNKNLEIVSQILKEITEKENKPLVAEEKKLSTEEQIDNLEKELKKILGEVDVRLGNNSIKGAERDELRNKQTELGAILRAVFNKEDLEKISKYIKEAKNLSSEEKDSLFKIIGTSFDELIEKESQEKEVIEKLRAKLREYVEIENKIINKETDEIKKGEAETRKRTYEHMINRSDWDLETYRKAVESEYSKGKGFKSLNKERYIELMNIITAEVEVIAGTGEEKILKIEDSKKTPEKSEEEIKQEIEKMILSELDEEILRMREILKVQKEEGKITDMEEYLNKYRIFSLWTHNVKDIATAKEMIGEAFKEKGGISAEEARRLYGILEIPENEINELVKAEELTPEERENKETERKITKMRGAVLHKQAALDSLFAKNKEDEGYQRASDLINKILGSKNIQEAVLNIREAKVMNGISLGEAETFLQQLELPDKEIDKEKIKILLVSKLNNLKLNLKKYLPEEDIGVLAKNEELLNKILENHEFMKINNMFATQEDEAIRWLAEVVRTELERLKKEEKPTEEEKRIEIRSRKDAEDYLAKREEAILASGNPELIENLRKMKEKIEWLKKAGV